MGRYANGIYLDKHSIATLLGITVEKAASMMRDGTLPYKLIDRQRCTSLDSINLYRKARYEKEEKMIKELQQHTP